MSTLSQFLPQGDSFLGEYLPGAVGAWGVNPAFGTREYLLTGNLKTYAAPYAALGTNFPALAANTPIANSASGWALSYLMYGEQVFSVGGNIHRISLGGVSNGSTPITMATWGSSLTATPSSQVLYGDDGANGPQVTGAVFFNNAVLVTGGGVFSPWGYPLRTIWRSTGTTYSSVGNPTYNDPNMMAASPSLCVVINASSPNATNGVMTSTNGTTWNYATTSGLAIGSNARRFFWSAAASCFVIIDSSGTIRTSTDGVNWTARTSPTGMVAPTGYGYGNGTVSAVYAGNYAAGTANETLCVLAQDNTSGNNTKLLKITAGPTFSIINLSDSPAVGGIFTTATTFSQPLIAHDGTRYTIVRLNSNYAAYSNDGGTTWLLDNQKVQTDNSSFSNICALNFAGGKYFVTYLNNSSGIAGNMIGSRIYDFGTRFALQTDPQLVGTSTASSFGTNTTAYVRIK